MLLLLVAIYILYEAYQRLHNPPEIQSRAMLIVAAFGLVVSLISTRLLSSGKSSLAAHVVQRAVRDQHERQQPVRRACRAGSAQRA